MEEVITSNVSIALQHQTQYDAVECKDYAERYSWDEFPVETTHFRKVVSPTGTQGPLSVSPHSPDRYDKCEHSDGDDGIQCDLAIGETSKSITHIRQVVVEDDHTYESDHPLNRQSAIFHDSLPHDLGPPFWCTSTPLESSADAMNPPPERRKVGTPIPSDGIFHGAPCLYIGEEKVM